MFRSRVLGTALLAAALVLTTAHARAACVNKYVHRQSDHRLSFTLLTGKLTFEEAKAMADAIDAGDRPKLQWIGTDGKTIARQFGPLRVVRPMPVSCDEKPSGVVMHAEFPATSSRRMNEWRGGWRARRCYTSVL
ncbi:MAG TPA: hypothetical protein VMS56_13365 [Thermoanaerobaculia bacterium]|nr:hypothetical protein [Thermoanaerobaculia bacterium]